MLKGNPGYAKLSRGSKCYLSGLLVKLNVKNALFRTFEFDLVLVYQFELHE